MPTKKQAAQKPRAKKQPSEMSPAHKSALAEGRQQGRIVRNYLEALKATRGRRRGPRRTPEKMEARIEAIDAELSSADAVKALYLSQERLNLTAELATSEETVDLDALQQEFVGVAAAFGARKEISYQAWRDVGVPAPVLKEAGITRSTK